KIILSELYESQDAANRKIIDDEINKIRLRITDTERRNGESVETLALEVLLAHGAPLLGAAPEQEGKGKKRGTKIAIKVQQEYLRYKAYTLNHLPAFIQTDLEDTHEERLL